MQNRNHNPLIDTDPRDTMSNCAAVLALTQVAHSSPDDLSEEVKMGGHLALECVRQALVFESRRPSRSAA